MGGLLKTAGFVDIIAPNLYSIICSDFSLSIICIIIRMRQRGTVSNYAGLNCKNQMGTPSDINL